MKRIFLILGIVLLVAAVAAVVIWQSSITLAEKKCRETVDRLYDLMPEVKPAGWDDRVELGMPMLEVDGENYVGILEVLKYDSVLPVAAQWEPGRVSKHPHRYTGSVYDGTLIIGGSDNAGQFDFMKLITQGDTVQFTDVTGGRYTYRVTAIERTKDVSYENLKSQGALVLFARSTYALDYTVVRCELG